LDAVEKLRVTGRFNQVAREPTLLHNLEGCNIHAPAIFLTQNLRDSVVTHL
jgi:hypothetical protein